MQKTFIYYQDGGHGWVKVPMKMIDDLGIRTQITSYSYQRKDYAYLEEDCDASTFIRAFKDQYKVEPAFRSRYSDQSRIRTYNHFDNGLHLTR